MNLAILVWQERELTLMCTGFGLYVVFFWP